MNEIEYLRNELEKTREELVRANKQLEDYRIKFAQIKTQIEKIVENFLFNKLSQQIRQESLGEPFSDILNKNFWNLL